MTRLAGNPPTGMVCPSFSYAITEQAFISEQFSKGKYADGRISIRAEPVPSDPVELNTRVPFVMSGYGSAV